MNPSSHTPAISTPDGSSQVGVAIPRIGRGFIVYLLGEFQVVNHHLLKDLTELGIWGEEMKHRLIAHHGSIQVTHKHTSIEW